MTFPRRLVAAALSLAAAAAAGGAAAQNMKPGLWEIQNKTSSSSGQMEQAMAQAQQHMANLPPEQRKMVEDMMAKQGMAVGAGGLARGVKICMSKEMVERNEIPAQQKGDCKSTASPRTGNTMKMTFTCTNPPASGEGQFTFVSSEAYTMQMTTTTTMQGKPEKMTIDASGKWLGADCGTLKPMGMPQGK